MLLAYDLLCPSVRQNRLFSKPSYELNRLKSPDVIRATDGLAVLCWTSNLGNLAGASSNPGVFISLIKMSFVNFIFVAES